MLLCNKEGILTETEAAKPETDKNYYSSFRGILEFFFAFCEKK